jgi:ribosomal protein S18 acetylase RimI-like enzyme
MRVVFRQNGWQGRYENFRLDVDGVEVAEVEFYYRSDGDVGVYSVEVWEAHRGLGHGRLLMQRVVRHLAGRPAYLYVWSDNRLAIGLYLKFGFEALCEVPEEGRTKVLMRRPGEARKAAA